MLNVFLLYHKNRSVALRNQLVTMNLGLARSVAHNARKATQEPYEDIESVAFLGLIASVERFDPTIGLKFSTYAIPTIYGKVLQYIRDRSTLVRIPQSLQNLYIKKTKAEAQLQIELGRLPNKKELATHLGIDELRLSELAIAKQNRCPISMSVVINASDTTTEAITLADSLPSKEYASIPELPPHPTELNVGVCANNILSTVFNDNTNHRCTAAAFGVSAGAMKRKVREAVVEYATTR